MSFKIYISSVGMMFAIYQTILGSQDLLKHYSQA